MTQTPDNNYFHIVNDLKEKIRQARIRASNVVNTQLLQLYWEIGTTILNEEKSAGWGAKIVDKLATDLRLEFSDMKGLSARNLRYMRDFASTYPHFPILQGELAKSQPTENEQNVILQDSLAKLSWYHHITLLDKVKERETREFYIQKTVENGWTRDTLVHQIESGLHNRQGALIHNFERTIQQYESELTQQLFKDPYKFEFLGLGEEAKEKDLEQALINQIEKVLLELGEGFALYGRQYKLNAGDKEYFIDLLFYHTKLRRYVVIELKIGDFLPEYVGKMNLYLGLADDKLKGKYDEPTIGLILCKTKDKIVAEYALRDTSKPIGIAEYKIAEMLPEDIKGELPSIEEIEQKLDEEIEHQKPVDSRLKAIKEKIKKINTEELQVPFETDIVKKLFSTSLKPLYEESIEHLKKDFQSEFITHETSWNFRATQLENINDLEKAWMGDGNLEDLKDVQFKYRLSGFKKAATEDFQDEVTLRLEFSKYWYGFTLYGINNNRSFLKKLYHEQLTKNDIDDIINWMITLVLDRLEDIIGKIENKNEIKKNG